MRTFLKVARPLRGRGRVNAINQLNPRSEIAGYLRDLLQRQLRRYLNPSVLSTHS
jgi:hypothetical protein